MATGLNAVNLADKWLNILGGTSFTPPSGIYVKLHTNAGEPGSGGTLNASAESTRKQITWAASSSGSKAMTGTLSWSAWSAGNETIGYVSLWDASTGGNCLWTAPLASPKSVTNGDTFSITTLTAALSPIAT